MAYSALKTAIAQVIKSNGAKEITGPILQAQLFAMIDSLGAGFQFMGVATPATTPGTPDQKVLYIGGAGTYTNFGSTIKVEAYQICVFAYNGSWSKSVINVGSSFEVEDYPAGDAVEFTFYSPETPDGRSIKINKDVSGLSNEPDEAISQWWAARAQIRLDDIQGFTIEIDRITSSSPHVIRPIETGKVIDGLNVDALIFDTINGEQITVHASDLPYTVPETFVRVRSTSTLTNVVIHVRGQIDAPGQINLNTEDLNFNSLNQIQFANRVYNSETPNGMGYVILRKDRTFAEQIADKPNTIFEIRYDFDLSGTTVTIPSNCVLKFNGGKLSDGYLVFSDTQIEGDALIDCVITGTIKNPLILVDWFGNHIFENINNLMNDGKTILFNKAEYDCHTEIKIFNKKNVTIDFNGATINDNIDSYEAQLSNIGEGKFRYSPLIFVIGCDNVTIKGLIYKARISNTQYYYNSSVLYIGRAGYSDEYANKNITIENCIFTDRQNSRANNFGCIGCIGNDENIKVSNIIIKNANFEGGLNFEYGAQDTNDFGLTGKFPTNVCVINVFGENLPAMIDGLIRTGGVHDIMFSNITAIDVLNVINYYCGDSGNNTFKASYITNNVKIKYTSSFIDTKSSVWFACNIINVDYRNVDEEHTPFDRYHQIYSDFIFNNLEINYEKQNGYDGVFQIINNRGKIILNNFNSTGHFMLGRLQTANINDADGNLIESYGVEINKGKIIGDRGFYVQGKIKNIILEDVYSEGKFFVERQSIYDINVSCKRCQFINMTWTPFRIAGDALNSGVEYASLENCTFNTNNNVSGFQSSYFHVIKCLNCVTSDGQGVNKYGPSSQRPQWQNVWIGFDYFDTSLGIKIFVASIDSSNNVIWVDSNGMTPGNHSGELADMPKFLQGSGHIEPTANDYGYQFTFTDDATYGDRIVWWNSNAGNGGAWIDADGTVVITNP